MQNPVKRHNLQEYMCVVLFCLFCLLFFYFFSYSIIVASDSAHYMSYVDIFKGISPWSSWDPVRGIVFPLILSASIVLFGKTGIGLLMCTFLFYVFMLFILFRTLEENLELKSKSKKIFIALTLLFVIINPIIFGYYHSFLTEFVGITLGVVGCYISWKYLKVNFETSKKMYVFYSVLLSILIAFAWSLKQPYVSTILFPLLISTLISIFENFKWKNILQRAVTLFVCIVSLIGSILVWNKFLASKGVDLSTDRNITTFLGNELVGAIDYFKVVKDDTIYTEEYISNNEFLTDEEKERLRNYNHGEYLIVNIHGNDGVQLDSEIIEAKNKFVGTFDSIKFILSEFIKRPILILDSYVANYLAMIDVYKTQSLDSVKHELIRELDFSFINENQAIAYRTFYNPENIFSMPEERKEKVSSFYQVSKPPLLLNKFMKSLSTPFNYIFKITFLLLPFTLIGSVLYRIFSKKRKNHKVLNYIIVALGFSFLHLLVHVVTGALIDRYASPAFITAIIGNILLFYILFTNILERFKLWQKMRKQTLEK